MNEFSAKKLGEVLAFGLVLEDTLEKSSKALTIALGGDKEKLTTNNKNHIDELKKLSSENNLDNIVLPKADKTKVKLIEMRNLYIGDEWDNPVELMEWGGFFHGAAIVHWELVSGVAEATNNPSLSELSKQAISTHKNTLKIAGDILKENGKKRSV